MKIKCSSSSRSASVLLICLGCTLVISIALAACLVAVGNENTSVARSQAWNNAMVTAEAGVEDGMALINQYANTSTPLSAWPSTASANGWSVNGGVYTVTRYINTNNFYTVSINTSGLSPVITSTGAVFWNNLFSRSTNWLKRTVQVTISTNAGSLFLDGILTKSGVTLSGGITIVSFNSLLPPWNTNSISIIPTTHNANATVATTESNVLAEIDITGNVKVYGNVTTGPNSNGIPNYIDTSGQASVGNSTWVAGGSTGVQTNHASDTLNISIPAPAPAPTSGYALPSGGTVNGTNYTYVFYNGTYILPGGFSMSGKQNALISGPVTLVVQGNMSMTGQSFIQLATNSTLTTYVSGASLSGQGIANNAGVATNLTIVDTSTNSISYSGNSVFIGTIYAPYDSVSLSGGGSSSVNFVGAVVANSAKVTGSYFFAYDEALGTQGSTASIYLVSSWQEIASQ